MIDLKFVQLPGTKTWVNVAKILRWGPAAITLEDRTAVLIQDSEVAITAYCTPQEFADLLSRGPDGEPPPKPATERRRGCFE